MPQCSSLAPCFELTCIFCAAGEACHHDTAEAEGLQKVLKGLLLRVADAQRDLAHQQKIVEQKERLVQASNNLLHEQCKAVSPARGSGGAAKPKADDSAAIGGPRGEHGATSSARQPPPPHSQVEVVGIDHHYLVGGTLLVRAQIRTSDSDLDLRWEPVIRGSLSIQRPCTISRHLHHRHRHRYCY